MTVIFIEFDYFVTLVSNERRNIPENKTALF